MIIAAVITGARAAGVLGVVVALLLGTGCTAERPPDEHTVDARDRVRTGLTVTSAATSGNVDLWSRVSTRPGTGEPAACTSVTWDTASYEQAHRAVMNGTLVSPRTCAPSTWFVARGDVVYVASDETPEGRHWFLHHWAHVTPHLLDELTGTADVGERFLTLVDTSKLVRDGADVQDDTLVFDIDLEALDAAGLVDVSELPDVTGRATFELTGDALTRIHIRLTGDDLSFEVEVEYSDLGVPQEFEIPEDPFLYPESPPITTAEQLRVFVGIA